MAKRCADNYLTDQNWEQEDEPQDAGKFESAPQDVLKSRVFKKAKRRIAVTNDSSAFKGFAGLTSSQPNASKQPADQNSFKGFNLKASASVENTKDTSTFLPETLNTQAVDQGFQPDNKDIIIVKPTFKAPNFATNEFAGSNRKSASVESVHFSSVTEDADSTVKDNLEMGKKFIPKSMSMVNTNVKSLSNDRVVSSTDTEDVETETPYMLHLRALNRSVSSWIAEHVEKDPLCDLTPIFRDYEKHLCNIEEEYGENDVGATSQETDSSELFHSSTKSKVLPADVKVSQSSTNAKQSSPSKPERPPKNPLGENVTPHASAASPFKGFGGFGYKPLSGFKFSSTMVQGSSSSETPSQGASTENKEEEYVPPVPDTQIVQEDGSFYTKKCKLFYMKDGSYAEKGVGHIHLKPVPDTKKTQLIIRAETSLGNLLLNIVLNSAMPVAKQGKNNVMVSCIPNPPVDEKDAEKVVPMLIRVKSSDDADELLELLNKKMAETD